MKVKYFANSDAVARAGAGLIAAEARASVQARGRFLLAVSGGKTPWQMLHDLADEDVPWNSVHVIQVDERVAPAGHSDRNLTHMWESLISRSPLPPDHVYIMPVEEDDLEAAAAKYSRTLQKIAGSPPVLDLVHLGLGPDGHTGSLVPNDPALEVRGMDVALTGIYQNRRRMTLTYPILNRSRRIMWVVTGSEKAGMLTRLLEGDVFIPGGRVRRADAVVLADNEAGMKEIKSLKE